MFIKKSKEIGFTLLELMIAMSLGIMVIGGAIGVFSATSSSNRNVLNSIKLNQELRGVMSFIVRDLRRAGGWNYAAAQAAWDYAADPNGPLIKDNPFNQAGQITGAPGCDPINLECVYSCVEYTYDLAGDGVFSNSNAELFGFGFANDVIRIRQGGTTCAAGMVGWESVTDDSIVKITNFQIIDRYPAGDGVQIRLLEVRITGELVNDSLVKRDLVEFVRIRNDYLIPPP